MTFLLFFIPLLPFSSSSSRCRQMSPQECSGQGRTSIENYRSTGSAAPQPGGSRADWAAPDLNRGALERTGQRRTSPGDLPSGVGSAGPQLPEDMSEDVSEICQKRMSERMSEEMPEDMSENMSKDMSEDMSKHMSEKNVRKECQKKCQKICQKKCQKIC